nr:unnamed protein product [Callosobruchus chinensis]
MGNPGWSYRDLLPTFIAMERNGNIESVDPRYHGTDGDMSVQYFPYQDQNVFHFLNAYQELGLELFDQNTERQVGTSLIQTFSSNGLRFTSNDAYIRPIRNQRPNLVIQRNAYVTRVLIDQNNRAYGVEYVQNGQWLRATASKEVILSAGSLMNPKVLMLSGVGPSNVLQQFNIQVLKDLPVGQNLHDHTTTDGVVIALSNLTATTATDQQRVRDVFQFRQTQRGPLAGTATLQVNAFVQTRYENQPDRPDIQFSLDPTNVRNFFTDPVLTAAATTDPRAYYDGVMVRPILLSPASRGYVTLNATDPLFGLPLVFPNTFQQDIDLLTMVEGMKQGVSITNTPTMRRIGARVVTIPLPACRHLPFGSDDYWACVAMSYTTTIYHPVGTCKMGPPNDPTAVVDPRLRVYGISNLRVIDASIMPKIMRANPEAGILAIGQKGAEFIISDWVQSGRAESVGHQENVGGNLGWLGRIFSRFW